MPSNSGNFHADTARLRWACRRGMLELDVLLSNYLYQIYPEASFLEQGQFISLLNYSDPELYSWLLGREAPPHQDLQNIVQVIRHHAQKQP